MLAGLEPERLADTLQKVYTRSDSRGAMPRFHGVDELEHNRLAFFWRALIDMGASRLSPARLQLIQPVTAWLEDEDCDRWSWCSRLSVPGLRAQVVSHAGLPRYRCSAPNALPEEFRTPAWRTLVRSVECFDGLDWRRRSLVVFQLAQMSFHRVALGLAESLEPDGDQAFDRFRYEVARVAASTPGQVARALRWFAELARGALDPLIRVAAAFQGIGHCLRSSGSEDARWFEAAGREAITMLRQPDSWPAPLVLSRFHRAVALLRRSENDRAGAQNAAVRAAEFQAVVERQCADDADGLIAAENDRYLMELNLLLALDMPGGDRAGQVEALCKRLNILDPFCVQARVTIADAYLELDQLPVAARWYEHAGELGTGVGALAWFRAGQCHLALGDGSSARNAMGRCLELDATAIEPRRLLAATYAT